jgi:ligand-binding sensor domain-containing protein
MRFIHVLIFFGVIIPCHLFSQTISPSFRQIKRSDGLPSITTYFVIQDSKGYMWITTDHGVARFDGYEFKVFTTKDGLEDNTVFNLFEYVKGKI